MPMFVLMTRLAPQAMNDATERRARGQEWIKKVHACCPEVKWNGHYALLGRYDFMDLYEAPDADTAHQVSQISRAKGALIAESWPAVPYEHYLELMEQV